MRVTARHRRTMVMRDNLRAAVSVLSLVGILSSFPLSQAQAQATCNLMHDLVPANPLSPLPALKPLKLTLDLDPKK